MMSDLSSFIFCFVISYLEAYFPTDKLHNLYKKERMRQSSLFKGMLLDGGCREGRKNKTEFSCKSSQEN